MQNTKQKTKYDTGWCARTPCDGVCNVKCRQGHTVRAQGLGRSYVFFGLADMPVVF